MANENKVDILLSVDLDATDTLKQIATLRQETTGLREEQKKLDRTTAEGAVEYERLNTQIKANTKTIQQHENEVVNSIKQDNAKEGSLKSMRAELSNAKAAYADLSKIEREGAKGKELLNKTAALNAELKELEGAYGDNQRKVGEYERAGLSLRSEVRAMTETLVKLTLAGENTSPEFQQMSSRLAELKDAMGDVNAQTNQMASDTAAFDTMMQGAQAVTASYNLWTATSAALGIENEALDETMQKMVVVMGALQSLQTLQNLAQKQSNLYRTAANLLQKIGLKQTMTETVATVANTAAIGAESVAENASTVAKTKSVVVTKLAAAAQWLYNAAVSANPVMLLVLAIGLCIAGISMLVGWLSKESAASRDAAVAQEAYTAQIEQSSIAQERLSLKTGAAINDRQLALRKELAELKANGATKEQIADAESKAAKDVRDIEIAASKAREAAARKNLAAARELANAQVKARDELRVGSKKWNEYNDAIRETNASIREHAGAVNDAFYAQQNLAQDQADAEQEAKDEQKRAAQERVNTAVSTYAKLIDEQKKFNEEVLKAEDGYFSKDIQTQQEYARRLFDLNNNAEKAKLDNLRKYNRITQDEYNRSLGVLANQLTAFVKKQSVDLQSYFESERNAILGLLTKTLDEQIAETEKSYADALKRLSLIEPPKREAFATQEDFDKAYTEYEAFMLKQIDITLRLESQKNKVIEDLRKTSRAAQIKEIEDETKDMYDEELAMFQDNERKKLETTIQMLEATIAAKKAAAENDPSISTADDEAALANARLQFIGVNLNSELILAEGSAKKRYDAKKKALDAEAILYADNADETLRIGAEMATAEQELFDARIENFESWAGAASDLLNGVMDVFNAQSEAQLKKIQEQYDAEAAALEAKNAKGLLSEAQYNKELLALNQKKEKEERRLEREKAIRERASKIFSVVTDTALGITKAVSASPLTGGLPWSAVMATVGALQLATILSEPLPKAARGGLIVGPKHAQGGTVIEAEGGEAIMSAKSVSMFGPLLSAINQLGGGVPFAAPLSDGGFVVRNAGSSQGLDSEEVIDAIRNLQIYTLIDDVNRGQKQFARMEARGNVL